MIVTLVGYRGTGKSSVAPTLAARLGDDWVDADAEIEERAACSIHEIFFAEGEAGFRRRERVVMSELLKRDRLVIAAGGGAVLDDETRREMQAAGPVVWLRASVETILARMQHDADAAGRRPPLTEHDPRTEVERLLAVREPLYRDAATIVVETDGRSVDQIVEDIVTQIGGERT